MTPLETLGCTAPCASTSPALAQPTPSLLAEIIQARLKADENGPAPAPLPSGVRVDLRPELPKVGLRALRIYMNRKAVDSLPLIYSALTLAHPN